MSDLFPRHVFIQQARLKGHSEAYIQKTTAYIDKLTAQNLPVIFSLKHLAMALNLSYGKLEKIIQRREEYYSTFRIRKKHSQGFREIRAPFGELKRIQNWINSNILSHVPLHEQCMSFRSGRSIKDNALIHQRQPVLLQTDFYRFYETISEQRVFGIFRSLGYHSNLAVDLAKLTTVQPTSAYEEVLNQDSYKPEGFIPVNTAFLPQGAPTSPAISNIIARRLDFRINKLARSLGIQYSRYADDITLSGTMSALPSIELIEKIVKEEGFYLHPKKTHFRKSGKRQLVTGLTITEGVHVPRKFKENIRQHLYYCKRLGPAIHMQNRGIQGKAVYKDWLLGNICFIHSVEPELGKKLFSLFAEIDWVL
ncbi:reverse transcriptase domain-containing protein [Paenibacillus alvei]|uniref:reverse transcriptase domain-containing protein n=1 Tax=Paenibacillus alvei TaxID=44250 RepID=UPI003D29B3CA